MNRIGIMQGRLVPPTNNTIQCFPRDRWADEFHFAAMAGLECIEWIYDLYGADLNPISTDVGVEKMRRLADAEGVQILSLCADYFMDKPLVRASSSELEERWATLAWLMRRCQLLGINRLVLPFVDASRVDTDAELESVCNILDRSMPLAEETKTEIHLETSLPPNRFADLLSNVQHPMLKVNYDSGNSSSLGYHPTDEFAAYGRRVGSIHIKDRVLGGSTVPLGTGDADFASLAESLRAVHYEGDIILQVARGMDGDEISWAVQNREFVRAHVAN